jgi:DNA-binding XRE family transcriptional regulator
MIQGEKSQGAIGMTTKTTGSQLSMSLHDLSGEHVSYDVVVCRDALCKSLSGIADSPTIGGFYEKENGPIYEARKVAGLTQTELAELIGSKQPVIARLEDADYEGHSLTMPQRIAIALNQRVEINFVPAAIRKYGKKT